MRAILGFGLAVLLVISAGVTAQDTKGTKKDTIDTKKLIGTWEPKELPAGATATVEFTKDGKLIVSFTFGGKSDKVEGTYKLDGVKLSVDLKEKKETSTITKLTDEELALKDDKGKEEAFKKHKAKK
jgi:uncharacterized protein (TIGR03066 family)